MHNWLKLESTDDIAKIAELIDAEFDPETVAQRLQEGISSRVAAILIEYNYIDKDYRSTYYNFYSKKGQFYRPDCVRLHFFDQEVEYSEDQLDLKCSDGKISHHYFGFMVLRPTGIGTVGRSVILPGIRQGAARFIIKAKYKVHLLGYELVVEGFPSMDQHADISVCAHAASWSILRHYSESYKIYRERLLYDITMMAQQYNPGGIVPSLGLALSQAERIFQEAKTFPVVVARAEDNRDDLAFYRQMHAYLDSRFPLFAADHTNGHAVAVVGYDWAAATDWNGDGMRFAWDDVASLSVVDDNHLPYLSIEKTGSAAGYSVEDFDSFIVALPEKVFYPADAVDKLAPTVLKIGGPLNLPPEEDCVMRYFLTTGSALRRFVRDQESEFDPDLVKVMMRLPFAQFVWVVEIATREQWAIRQVTGRAFIDATASPLEFNPLWLIHGMQGAMIFERRKVNVSPEELVSILFKEPKTTGFSRMEQNVPPHSLP